MVSMVRMMVNEVVGSMVRMMVNVVVGSMVLKVNLGMVVLLFKLGVWWFWWECSCRKSIDGGEIS